MPKTLEVTFNVRTHASITFKIEEAEWDRLSKAGKIKHLQFETEVIRRQWDREGGMIHNDVQFYAVIDNPTQEQLDEAVFEELEDDLSN